MIVVCDIFENQIASKFVGLNDLVARNVRPTDEISRTNVANLTINYFGNNLLLAGSKAAASENFYLTADDDEDEGSRHALLMNRQKTKEEQNASDDDDDDDEDGYVQDDDYYDDNDDVDSREGDYERIAMDFHDRLERKNQF